MGPTEYVHLKTGTVASHQNIVFEIKDRTMTNVHNCHSYIGNHFYSFQ
jgi:hypothetical protein